MQISYRYASLRLRAYPQIDLWLFRTQRASRASRAAPANEKKINEHIPKINQECERRFAKFVDMRSTRKHKTLPITQGATKSISN
jgi:hypothetical protein